jgi:WD40 repeat protein
MAGLDGAGVRVVVAGTGTHAPGSRLPDVPAVAGTVAALARCYTRVCGVSPENMAVLVDPAGPEELLDIVLDGAAGASDVLVFHYVGHGLLNATGELHLGTHATVDLQHKAGFQALAWSEVVGALNGCRARQVLVVLDCCYSARASVPVRSGALLTSADRDEQALAPPGEEFTAFSGALMQALTEGIATAPALLTLTAVHDHLTRVLTESGRPAPVLQTGNAVRGLVLAPNAADRSVPAPGIATTLATDDGTCPYRGLEPYSAADHVLFHGRTELVERVLLRVGEQVRTSGPLIVTGPSGSGKSSLLHAGVGPSIRHGDLGITGSAAWPVVSLVPGADPLGALGAALSALDPDGGQIAIDGVQTRARVAAAMRAAMPEAAPDGRVVIIVDQFEEIFDAEVRAADRTAFVAALDALSTAEAVVLLSMRSDFTGRCAQLPELVRALEAGPVLVGPMTTAELRSAITEPARIAGLTLEPGLVELLLRDAGADPADDGFAEYDPGVLPLLSHALLGVWQRRRGATLTVAAYRDIGGVAGAVASTAEAAHDALSPDRREVARALLLRLVRASDDVPDTRRRAARDALMDTLPAAAADVLDGFTAARLITVDDGSVQISHEALIRSWPRLRDWMDAERGSRLVAQQVEDDATGWQEAGRDPALLYRGSKLGRARAEPLDIGSTAAAFLDASARAEARAARRVRQVMAVLAVLLLLAVSGVAVAAHQTSLARAQADTAIAQKLLAQAGELAATDRSLAAQLTLAAYRIDPSSAARARIIATLDTPLSYIVPSRPVSGDAPNPAVAAGPRGHLSVIHRLYFVELWALDEPAQAPAARIEANGVVSVALSPDERLLAVSDRDGVRLWDVTDATRPAELDPPLAQGGPGSLAFSGDGRTLACAVVTGDAQSLVLWSVADPTRPMVAGTAAIGVGRHGLAFAPDSPTLAMIAEVGQDRSVELWDVSDAARPARTGAIPGGADPVSAVALGRHSTLVTGHRSGAVAMWDATDRAAPRPTRRLEGGSTEISAVAVDADLRFVAAASETVLLWGVATPSGDPPARQLVGHAGGAFSLAFSGSTPYLLTGGYDGTARRWFLHGSGTTALPGTARRIVADGRRGLAVLATGDADAVEVVDAADPSRPTVIGPLPGPAPDPFADTVITPDGQVAAVASDTYETSTGPGRLDVVNLSDPRRPVAVSSRPLARNAMAAMTLRPDGGLLAIFDGETGTLQTVEQVDTPPVDAQFLRRDLAGSSPALAFGPDGRLLAMTDYVISGPTEAAESQRGRERLRLWDVADPTRPRPLGAPVDRELDTPEDPKAAPFAELQFTSDGRYLLSLRADGVVVVWDVSDPSAAQPIGRLTSTVGPYSAIALSPSAHTVATVAGYPTAVLEIWDISDPAQPVRGGLRNLATAEPVIAFATSRTLLVADGPQLTTLPTDFDAQVDRICTEAGAELTEQQWRTYVGTDIERRPLC